MWKQVFRSPYIIFLHASEKDPSTTLGMTIRENGRSHIHFHTAAGDNLRPFGHFNKKNTAKFP